LVRTFPLGRSNRRANFKLSRSKVKVTGRQKRHVAATHLAYVIVDGGLHSGRLWRSLQAGPNTLCVVTGDAIDWDGRLHKYVFLLNVIVLCLTAQSETLLPTVSTQGVLLSS